MRRASPLLRRSAWVSLVAATLGLATSAAAGDGAQSPSGDPAQPAPQPAAEDAARAEARAHFEKGVALLQTRAFDAALAEFERSRAATPTRSATENAAVCLREVGRLDEAWEMFGRVLADFGELPDDVRSRIERQRADLDARLGAITIVGGESGAVVSVDGRPRGTLPLPAPLRASAGLHTVRVHLEGYVPFVEAVDVVATKATTLRPELAVLAQAGRLRISDRRGRGLEVVVDGVVVGRSPWEGALAPGDHAVWLAGPVNLGTAPTRGRVIVGQRSELVLNAIELDSVLSVRVTPPDATLVIDGVVVGKGAWSGKLPPGPVAIAASAPGYASDTRTVKLATDGRADLDVVLVPTKPETSRAAPSATVELGLRGGLDVAPVVLGEPCEDPCSRAIGLGAHLDASVLLRFPEGFGVGGSLGYLRFVQTQEGRTVTLAPPGRPAQAASVNEGLTTAGMTAAVVGSYRLGDTEFLGFDLAAGGFFGAASDERTIGGVDSTGAPYSIGPYHASGTVLGVVVAPSVRIGFVPIDPLELSLAAGGDFLVPLKAPTFEYDAPVPVGADGAARLASSQIFGSAVAAFSASLGVGLRL